MWVHLYGSTVDVQSQGFVYLWLTRLPSPFLWGQSTIYEDEIYVHFADDFLSVDDVLRKLL